MIKPFILLRTPESVPLNTDPELTNVFPAQLLPNALEHEEEALEEAKVEAV